LKNKLQATSVIGEALRLFKENPGLFVLLALIGEAGVIFKVGFMWLYNPAKDIVIDILLYYLIAMFVYIAFTYIANKKYLKKPVTLKEGFSRASELFLKYVLVVVLVYLAVGGGLILLVLPGIYFFVVFFIADTICVIEDAPVKQCLVKSREWIKDSFWQVFLAALLMFGISLVVYIPVYMTSELLSMGPLKGIVEKEITDMVFESLSQLFIMPLFGSVSVVVYNRLKKGRK